MKRNFFDPTIVRKSNIVDDRIASLPRGLPLPSIIEISESGTCNRACAFCPRSAPGFPDIKEFIDISLLQKLFSEVADVGFEGLVLFSGFVEPLLDKNIFEKVKLVRDLIPGCRIEMVTNGDVLKEEILKKLVANGLDTLLISVYDGKEDADRFVAMCQRAGLNEDQFVIRNRYLSESEDFGMTISNRSGMLENAEYVRPPLKEPLKLPCFYPSYLFFMDYLGDVLLCPHDWGKTKILGNLKKQSFIEIWGSQMAIAARKQLNHGNRNLKPCNVCDVEGTYIGKRHAELWANLGDYQIMDVFEKK